MSDTTAETDQEERIFQAIAEMYNNSNSISYAQLHFACALYSQGGWDAAREFLNDIEDDPDNRIDDPDLIHALDKAEMES